MNTPSHGELMKLAIDIEDLLNAATTLHQDDSRATILTMEREYLELLDAKPEELIRINSRTVSPFLSRWYANHLHRRLEGNPDGTALLGLAT